MSGDQYHFTGSWQLIPELCQYQDGHPPLAGRCDITTDGDVVSCATEWTDEHGKDHALSHGGPMDGSVVALGDGKLEVSYTRIDAYRLDNAVYADGRETSYAHRKTSMDGTLMVMVTVHHHKDTRSTRNFQVYRRQT